MDFLSPSTVKDPVTPLVNVPSSAEDLTKCPDNQLGLNKQRFSIYSPSTAAPTPLREAAETPGHADGEGTESEQPEVGAAGDGDEVELHGQQDGKPVLIHGTMYQDGTYWKKLVGISNLIYMLIQSIGKRWMP